MCYHAKLYCPGQRLLGSVRGWKKHKRVQEGDYLTSKQNVLPTVSNSWPGMARISSAFSVDCHDLICLLLLLLRTIKTAGISSAFSVDCQDLVCRLSLQLDRQDLVCLLLLLLRTIKMAGVSSAFSYCWWTVMFLSAFSHYWWTVKISSASLATTDGWVHFNTP